MSDSLTGSHENHRASNRPQRPGFSHRSPLRGQTSPDPRGRDAPLRRARLPRHAHRGHRHRAFHRQGLGLPAFRQQGRSVSRGLQEGRGLLLRLSGRAAGGDRPRLLRDPALLARTDRPARPRELGPLPRGPARQLRDGPEAAPGDQSVPARPGPLRNRGLRPDGRRARRGPLRHRRRDDGFDDRVDGGAFPGRAPDRGARSGSLLAPGQPPREDGRAHRPVPRASPQRHRDSIAVSGAERSAKPAHAPKAKGGRKEQP